MNRGFVVSFARGYGFITTGTSVDDTSAPRYFFHSKNVKGSTHSITVGKMVTFRITKGRDDRLAAVDVSDAFGEAIDFKRTADINMNVSGPGRRVGIVTPQNKPVSYCFIVDQESGERVFVPIPLVRGQQIEYTLEMTARGPSATDVTGPMGSRLTSAKPGKAPQREEKPKAVVNKKSTTPEYFEDDDDYYAYVDDKYM